MYILWEVFKIYIMNLKFIGWEEDQEGGRERRGETAPELNFLDDVKFDILNRKFSNYLKLIIILKDYFPCFEKIG